MEYRYWNADEHSANQYSRNGSDPPHLLTTWEKG